MADVGDARQQLTATSSAKDACGVDNFVLIEELDEGPHRPCWGTVRFTPAQLLRDEHGESSLQLGAPTETRLWLCCRTYSKEAKALQLPSSSRGPPGKPAETLQSWHGSRAGDTFFLCSSATEIVTKKVFGPPMKTVHSDFEYRMRGFRLVQKTQNSGGMHSETMVLLEDFCDVQLPLYIPSTILAVSESLCFVGNSSSIDLSLNAENVVSTLHSFTKVPGKAVSCMAYHKSSGLLVAVDDIIWPKFAFVFDCAETTPKHRFTACLPEAKEEHCTAAALCGDSGDILILTAKFNNRMGEGQRIVVIRVVEDGFEQLASHREFIPVEDDDEEEEEIEIPPKWHGLVVVGDCAVVGAEEALLTFSISEAIEGRLEPALHPVECTVVHLIASSSEPGHVILLADHYEDDDAESGSESGGSGHFSEIVIMNCLDSSRPTVARRHRIDSSPVHIM